jgi:hypothetical protein
MTFQMNNNTNPKQIGENTFDNFVFLLRSNSIGIILFILILTSSINSQGQNKGEFQIKAGVGLGSYLSETNWTYSYGGIDLKDSGNDTFIVAAFSLELGYMVAQRFRVGLDCSIGREGHSEYSPYYNSFTSLVRFGPSVAYDFVSKPNFRFYGAININHSRFRAHDGLYIGPEIPYQMRSYWRGASVVLSPGILGFIKDTNFGFHINLSADGRYMRLHKITFDDEEQNIENIESDVSYSGLGFNFGIVWRIRPKTL